MCDMFDQSVGIIANKLFVESWYAFYSSKNPYNTNCLTKSLNQKHHISKHNIPVYLCWEYYRDALAYSTIVEEKSMPCCLL